jgi:hypothetical protein
MVNKPAQSILPELRRWEDDYRRLKTQTLADVGQIIQELRVLTIFIILNAYRLFIVFYEKEPEDSDYEEVKSLVAPSVSLVYRILDLVEIGREPGREFSCFKVQYEWAVRSVVEAISAGRSRGWNSFVESLEGPFLRVLENHCCDLRVSDDGMTLLTSWDKKTKDGLIV